MSNAKYFTTCPLCKKWKLRITKREVDIPGEKQKAISSSLMCKKCGVIINNLVKSGHDKPNNI